MSSGREVYSDIFGRPHHVSTKRLRMSRANRAAQFSPFAALVGYEASVNEAARTTDEMVELSEDNRAKLNMRLCLLHEHLSEQPTVNVIYFEADKRKSDGAYLEYVGVIKKFREYERVLVTNTNIEIPFSSIISLSGELFRSLEY